MIAKKVARSPKAGVKSRASNIRDLANYIANPGAEEKVLYENGRNFGVADATFEQRREEMVMVAERTQRSRDPVAHYILSWREGEQPAAEEVDRAVTVVLEELGLDAHQVVYGLHDDTDNIHLHMAVNRVHPRTGKVVSPNRGFDIEALHRAVARIEHEQGWASERNARYVVLPDGSVARNEAMLRQVGDTPRPGQRARDYEQRTGEKSAQRIAIEQARPIFREATSWTDLHERLGAVGMAYERKGTGALLWVGAQPVKPSSVDRSASFGALEKRLGAFQPRAVEKGAPDARRDDNDPSAPGDRAGVRAGPGVRDGDHQPDLEAHAAGGATRENGRLRALPERDVVPHGDGSPVLLQGDARVRLGTGEAERHHGVRRAADRAGGRVGDIAAGIAASRPILRESQSWGELHLRLAEIGVTYDRKGSGAVLRVDGYAVKASSVGRDVSFGALEKRLGPYAPAVGGGGGEQRQAPARRRSEPAPGAPSDWGLYSDARKAHYAAKDAALADQRKRHDAERDALRTTQRAQREEHLRAIRDKEARQAARSLVAAAQASERADLRDRFREERKAVRGQFPRFPDFETWLRERDPEKAGQWRFRASAPAEIAGDRYVRPAPQDIRGFQAAVHGGDVFYHRRAAQDAAASFVDRGRVIQVAEAHDRAAVLASLQLGAQKWGRVRIAGEEAYKKLAVEVAAENGIRIENPELLADYQRARAAIAERYRFPWKATGTDESFRPPPFRPPRAPNERPETHRGAGEAPGRQSIAPPSAAPAASAAGAAGGAGRGHEGFRPTPLPRIGSIPPSVLHGPLRSVQDIPTVTQEATTVSRNPATQLQQPARSTASRADALAAFDAYHEAVGADRYRVTAIKMTAAGDKQAFILDKRNGVSEGFTPDELRDRLGEMKRLERRGENLYFTPMSAARHHILVDDMTSAKLDRLLADGFAPAVVLKTSPNNFQAVLNVPKAGSPFDRDVGNRLALQLNKKYGDPNLSGAVHPHRAPSFANQKPKHLQPDGTYPVVALVSAEARDSDRATALARELQEIREQEAERARQRRDPVVRSTARELPAASAAAPYFEHYNDITRRFPASDVNYSRIDSMVAVRLRATGHSHSEIAEAIASGAPAVRPADKADSHRWTDYANRTADYAFSASGSDQLDRTRRFHDQWRRLEGGVSSPALTERREAPPRPTPPALAAPHESAERGTLAWAAERAAASAGEKRVAFVSVGWAEQVRVRVYEAAELQTLDDDLKRALPNAGAAEFEVTEKGAIQNAVTGQAAFVRVERDAAAEYPPRLRQAVEAHFAPAEPEDPRATPRPDAPETERRPAGRSEPDIDI